MNRKYRPSNGTEGMIFEEKFCMNCFHCDPNPDGPKQCEILLNMMSFDTNDAEYPKELIYDENGKGICTNYKKWDWGNDGDPDNPDNPNYTPPDDPNQLVLPFELIEIEKENLVIA